jgi:hypothetical protein
MLAFAVFFAAYAFARAKNVEMFNLYQQTLDRNLGALNTVLLITGSWFVVLPCRRHIATISRPCRATSCSASCGRRFPDRQGHRIRGQVRRRHHDVDQHLLHVLHLADLLPFHARHSRHGDPGRIWVQARKGLTAARMRTAWRAARLTGTWSICCGSSFSLSFM